MSKVILKFNLARIVILKARSAKGIIKKIILRPMTSNSAFHHVDADIWALVKGQPFVKQAIKDGDIVVISEIDEGDELVDVKTQTKRLKGNVKVKAKEVDTSGDDNSDDDTDNIADDTAELPATIDELVDSLDGEDETKIKLALRDYANRKYDMKLGNAGIPKMIEMVKEKEVDA